MEKLFSYGTLQLLSVQQETFGRVLAGQVDTLTGYVLPDIRIKDEAVIKTSSKEYHPILKYSGNIEDKVEGTIFEITTSELAQANEYEVEEYRRVKAKFISGTEAWVYVCAKTQSETFYHT